MKEKNIAELALSPEGHVYFLTLDALPSSEPLQKIKNLFDKGSTPGLLHLGIQDFNFPLPPSFLFWQNFSRKFITQICKQNSAKEISQISPPNEGELQETLAQAFTLKGAEYLTTDTLVTLWQSLTTCLQQELSEFSGDAQAYFNRYNPRWNLVGRICFHLAENKKDEQRPFAFLATYTTQLSQRTTAQHLPLKRALQDYAGEKDQASLLALLLPVQKAASQSAFVKEMVDTGSIYQPQTWTARQAHRFLKEIPLMESSGIMVRIPNWWNAQKPPRPKVVVKLGENRSSSLGLDTLLDFDMHLSLDNGERLTSQELEALMQSTGNLVQIKGQWVEVDRDKLNTVLAHWGNIRKAANEGLSLAESLRLLAGGGVSLLDDNATKQAETTAEWSTVLAGGWLKSTLEQLRNPHTSSEKTLSHILNTHLQATLRPYQLAGVQWLWLLYQLKLGGCLADDMGLGKTIQVLSLLLAVKHHPSTQQASIKPHLLIVPASLIGNWQAELSKFSPSLKFMIAHSSANSRELLKDICAEELGNLDIVITTYAFVHRLSWLKKVEWNVLILDEAQQIKNPSTKQTLAVKELKSQVRIALTGTPIENRLSDLWSLFDFTSPGLLGSMKSFSTYAKGKNKENTTDNHSRFIKTMRGLTQPYILRRLKSDKKIIADLPDKTEMQTFVSLSKEQIKLYQQAVDELKEQLHVVTGIQRKGLVFSYMMRFKQICNHPTQWLGYGDFDTESSGKFLRLQEIGEEIAARQEKVLIFTQFKEVIPALASLLTKVFGREGLILHGETPVKKRGELVESFQQELGPPFFVLSLKAGGTGLNLTRASHVVHFDRWWNPAVENQATDRAYRIGQKHPVLVHKFICRGTIEEKIDHLIESKKNLSKELLEGSNEITLTEMSNEELLGMISLDLNRAMGNA